MLQYHIYIRQICVCSLVEDIKAMFVCPTAFRFPPFFTFSETNESRILCFAHFAENHKSSVSRHWHFHSYLWQLFQPKPILMFQKDSSPKLFFAQEKEFYLDIFRSGFLKWQSLQTLWPKSCDLMLKFQLAEFSIQKKK